MAIRQFRLPDLGEGLTEGEILQWLVTVGDEVRLNQPIVEVETAKAAVEVPSPYAGVVTALHHAAGETVRVGTPIISFETEPAAGGTAVTAVEPAATAVPASAPTAGSHVVTPTAAEPGLIGAPAPGGLTSVLVGYGPRAASARRRPRRPVPPPPSVPPVPPARVSAAAVGEKATGELGAGADRVAVLAKPPVRKLARDLGIDLAAVPGSGPRGMVTRADVEAAARQMSAPLTLPATAQRGAAGTPAAPAPAGEEIPAAQPAPGVGGREWRIPVKGVRRATAAAMTASAFTAPHVSEFLAVDVTAAMELRRRLAARPEFAEVRVTPLLLVAKALLLAVRRSPMVNSSWDEAAREIVVKDQVNLGIAASTPRGLVVPNIKNAGQLGLPDLARALQELTTTAREGRASPADMQGGTITITNVGAFGVDAGTPILNPGEAAILCVGAVRDTPWVYEGQLAVRKVAQLALSFDHRIIDGELGSRFLADVGQLLSDPVAFLAWG